MSAFNPYAPPKADVGAPLPRYDGVPAATLDEARRRLEQHLAEPARVAADRLLIGPRVRVATRVLGALTLLFALALLGGATVDRDTRFLVLGVAGILDVTCALLFAVLLAQDLTLDARTGPAPPEKTMRGFLRSLVTRPGYAVACLCPTGREQIVEPPSLGDVKVGQGQFRLTSADEAKRYAQTFCRPGGGQIRQMIVKRVTLRSVEGDVATVNVELTFQSFPQWANTVALVALILVRLLGLILFVVVYLGMRKRFRLAITKTLLRGGDGLWYALDARMFE